MKIINRTHYPMSMLREIAEFARPKKLKTITIEFRYTRTSIGRGHYTKKLINGRKHKWAVVNIPRDYRDHHFPNKWVYGEQRTMGKRLGYLNHLQLDLEELILHITAHELRHARQHEQNKIHWVYGTKYTKEMYGNTETLYARERDADAYAIRTVRKWRRLQKPIITIPDEFMERDVTEGIYFSNRRIAITN